jgi:hypothetical protein
MSAGLFGMTEKSCFFLLSVVFTQCCFHSVLFSLSVVFDELLTAGNRVNAREGI